MSSTVHDLDTVFYFYRFFVNLQLFVFIFRGGGGGPRGGGVPRVMVMVGGGPRGGVRKSKNFEKIEKKIEILLGKSIFDRNIARNRFFDPKIEKNISIWPQNRKTSIFLARYRKQWHLPHRRHQDFTLLAQ